MSARKKILIPIIDHVAFDDRIFFKEAQILAKLYDITILSIQILGKKGYILNMGGESVPSGTYDNVKIVDSIIFNGMNVNKTLRRVLNLFFVRFFLICYALKSHLQSNSTSKYDLLHIHDPVVLVPSYLIRFLLKLKYLVIFDCHEYFPLYVFSSRFRLFRVSRLVYRTCILKFSIARADAVIVISKTMRTAVSLLAPKTKICVIRNSSILSPSLNNENGTTGTGPITLVHEGNLSFDRGLSFMLSCFDDPWIRDHVQLKIIGKLGKSEAHFLMQQITNKPHLKECIREVGWIPYEDLDKHLKGDIGLIFMMKNPNTIVGLPNKFFNYLCKGIPIITLYLPEILNEGDSLIDQAIFPINENIDELKEAINKIAANKSVIQHYLAEAGKHFSWELEAPRLINFYSNIFGETK